MSKLLTVAEAFEQYPELHEVANETYESLVAKVGYELTGFRGIPSRVHENRVLICTASLEDYLHQVHDLLTHELGPWFNLQCS